MTYPATAATRDTRGRAVPPALSARGLALLATAAGAAMFATSNARLALYDEGIIEQGAAEVMHGLVPHRDFYFNYGPAQIWVLAGLFWAFGKSVTVARLYDLVVRMGIVFAGGLVLDRLGVRRTPAGAILGIETGMLIVAAAAVSALFPLILLALAATLLLVGPGPGSDVPPVRLAGAGALVGAAALVRYDAGFLVLLAHLAALAWFGAASRKAPAALAGQVIAYGLGTAAVFLPVAAAAWWIGAVPGFRHDIIAYPSTWYARMRSMPLPRPSPHLGAIPDLVFYLPVPAAALAAASLLRRWRHGGGTAVLGPGDRLLAALALLTAALFLKGVVRTSFVQTVMAAVPAVLVLGALVSARARWERIGASLLVLAFAAVTGGGLVMLAKTDRHGDGRDMAIARAMGRTPAAMTGRPCPPLPALGIGAVDDGTWRAACFIRAHSRADEPIFVGAGRHDKLFVNNVALYFVAGRMPGTHWYHFDPGLQTRADIQRAIIRDLLARHVRLVALDRFTDDVEEPNDSARSSHVLLLDAFLRATYRPVARFGTITVAMRPGG